MSNTAIERIVANGFFVDEKTRIKHVAALSLRTALKAYAATYSTMRLHISQLDDEIDPDVTDMIHNLAYCETAVETIIHFQHFAELVCKDILSNIHPLMADETSRNAVVLYKLLKNEKLSEQEDSQVRLIEFTDALDRVVQLNRQSLTVDPAAELFAKGASWLRQVNKLRNRSWHRGRFILHCDALDTLMGCYILPFIQSLLEVEPYNRMVRQARYKVLSSGIDPFQEIIKRYQMPSVDKGAIAFLKEMARAAYESPLSTGKYAKMFNEEPQAKAEVLTRSQEREAAGIRKCSVCGLQTLLLFDDVAEFDGVAEAAPEYTRYTYAAKCMCCGFYVTSHLKNPRDYGLELEDYWFAY